MENNVDKYQHKSKPLLPEQFLLAAFGNNQPAIRWGEDQYLTWKQVGSKASQLAHYLKSDFGLKKGECIAVCYPRSPEFFIATYAILLAGGVYFPVDQTHPLARIASMFETAKCRIAFADESLASALVESNLVINWINRPLLQSLIEPVTFTLITSPCVELTQSDPAYLIFTSGTTGKPKGVLVNHGALANRLLWHFEHSKLESYDVILQRTALTFDVSLWEIFLPVFIGASSYLLQPGYEVFPKALVLTLIKSEASVVHFVPSLLKPVLQELVEMNISPAGIPALRQVYVSGEPLLPALINQFHDFFENECRLTNLYGPTEAAIDVTFYDCVATVQESVPIGRCIPGCEIYIVDEQSHQLKAPTERGEIAIAGTCLAQGYLNRPDLTESAFIWHDELKKRVYLTGDLGWVDSHNHNFYCKGRRDCQIKLNGLRIELSEIEHHLLRLSFIKEVVICLVSDGDDCQWLVAAIVSNQDIDSGELRQYLADYLPSYMIPSRFWRYDKLPRSSSGKQNRKDIAAKLQEKFSRNLEVS